MYDAYIIPGAVILFLVSFVCGLNIGMMLMQHRNNNVSLQSAQSLYPSRVRSADAVPHRKMNRELRKRDFVLDFGIP